MFGVSITPALLITPAMCIGDDDVGKSEVLSTVFFVDGIATLLQTTFGSRYAIYFSLNKNIILLVQDCIPAKLIPALF